MRWLSRLVASVGLLAAVGSADADKLTAAEAKARALLEDVKKATDAKEGEKGAKAVVELAAVAAKEKSLGIEERAAEAFEGLLDALEGGGEPAGGTTSSARQRDVLAIVMKSLDPAHHGVFLSAHALASELVLRAIEKGDAAHLDDALATLTAYGATPKGGKAGPALLKLAQGVKAARSNDAKAGALLEAAAAALREGRWTRPTLACALERVTSLLNSGDVLNAGKLAQEALSGLSAETDAEIARTWSQAVRARLPDLPEAIKSAMDAALAPLLKAGGAGAAGGRGGNAVSGPSPLGKAWAKLTADKAFVTVKRDDDGYELRLSHDKKLVDTKPFQSGQRNWDRDGVSLLFADGAIALRMLVLAGDRGQPGERSRVSPAWAWYPLAPGEIYAASMNGVVITGP